MDSCSATSGLATDVPTLATAFAFSATASSLTLSMRSFSVFAVWLVVCLEVRLLCGALALYCSSLSNISFAPAMAISATAAAATMRFVQRGTVVAFCRAFFARVLSISDHANSGAAVSRLSIFFCSCCFQFSVMIVCFYYLFYIFLFPLPAYSLPCGIAMLTSRALCRAYRQSPYGFSPQWHRG